MKNLLVSILFSCVSFLVLAYAATPATPATHKIQIGKELPTFHSIHVTGDVKLYMHQSATNSFKAELPASLEEYFTLSVENGVLQIQLTKTISRFDMPKVELYFSEVNTIQAEGGYYLKMDETYITNKLELILTGSGLTNLILDVQELKAEISGQAVASVKGKSLDAKVHGSQESYWAASSLNTSTLLVSVEGMAKAEVNAQKYLTAIADNSGQIHCSGEAEIRSYIHGLGTIVKVPSL
jgi:hypothetical protein